MRKQEFEATKQAIAVALCSLVREEVLDACLRERHASEFGNHNYRYNATLCESCAELIDSLKRKIRAEVTPDDHCVHDRPCKDGAHSVRCDEERAKKR